MKVVIVGGVAGGAGTAARLRRNDEQAEIIMLERGSYISYANCGLPYYIGGVITEREALQLQTPESFGTRFHVDVRTMSEVAAVDTARKCVVVKHGGETYEESYDKLVLSPGAGPVRPGIPGMEKNHVFTLRNIPDTYAIHDYVTEHNPVSCAVIGAGFIGLEMAENLAEQGLKVSVVEGASHVMPPIDMDMAHGVHNYIRSKGIDLYLGQTCTAMDGSGVILKNGAKVPADMVIMSIGVRPDTGFLNMVITKLGGSKFPFLSSPSTAMFSLVLVMVWKSVGYYVLLIMAALQTVPTSIYEAAELDDTPKIRTFFKITLPMISPTILFTSVVASIASFKIFDSVNVMTQGGPVDSTNTLVYYIYSFAFRYGKPGMACAAGVVLLVLVCIMTYVQFGAGKKKVHYQ